ncbi:hypothetical protein PUW81_004060 [Microbacterium sp. NM3R9]|uniref:hypothetical protein n=1 Tax=Microbacterium thalli TaxID=3027921 RepID=UPI00236626D4|nr:hypothetical protein [Microbacterium thalli]MDN8548275.1 hypothetical protein [Microbacterium thalli]
MSTTLTPPTTPPTPPAEPPRPGGQQPAPASGARAIAILTAVAGGALILGAMGTGVLSTVSSGSVETSTATAETGGVTALAVDTSAADVEISFGDVDEATLTVTGVRGADAWQLARDGDILVVDSERDWWNGWNTWGDISRATLVLPAELAGVDAELRVDAGQLRVEGDFGALALRVDAGSLDAVGSATTLDTNVSAGRASVELDGVTDAAVSLSAGRVTGSLTGTPPASVTVDAEAGAVDLTLPRGSYAVDARRDAGNFTNGLTEDATSPHRVDVRVSAGSVSLRPAVG